MAAPMSDAHPARREGLRSLSFVGGLGEGAALSVRCKA